jgi:hypothetical protein
LIKGLLGAVAGRCTALSKPVAWASLLHREKAEMGSTFWDRRDRGAVV